MQWMLAAGRLLCLLSVEESREYCESGGECAPWRLVSEVNLISSQLLAAYQMWTEIWAVYSTNTNLLVRMNLFFNILV